MDVRVASHVSALPPCQLTGLTPIVLTAIYEGEREQEVQTNPPNEQLDPGLESSAEREFEDWNRQGREDRGTVTERPTGIPPEHMSDDSHIDEDSHEAVQFGTSEGESSDPAALSLY
jgi:hypothetical protein